MTKFATGKRHLRDREAIDLGLDALDALVAIHPDAARDDAPRGVPRQGVRVLSRRALRHRADMKDALAAIRNGGS